MTDDPPMTPGAQFVVYGSCVSRDLAEIALGGRRAVARYTARQSLISGFSESRPSLVVPPDAPLSTFQRRMVEEDIRGALPHQLREAAARGVRRLLWDLVDERLGVYVLADGSAVTRSIDLMSAGLDEQLARSATLLPLGSRPHIERWDAALVRFQALVADVGIEVVLLDIAWAARDDRGEATPLSFGLSAAKANAVFRPYVSRAASLFRCASLGPDEVTAAHDHQWGVAPFHYTQDTYRRAAANLPRTPPDDPSRSRPPAA